MFIPPAPAAPLPPLAQDHLEAAGMDPALAVKLVAAHALLLQLFRRDQLVSVAWSGGKDSTVCLIIAVRAYHDAVLRYGLTLPMVVTSSDTGIENPVVHFHWLQMIAYLQAYAERYGLDIRFKVAAPTLISSWVVKIISGCGLPTFTNSKQRKCAIDLKREPANRVLKKLIPEIRADISAKLDSAPADFLRLQQMQDALASIEPVVIVGTRFGESVERDKRMTARGDAAGLIRRNADGFLTLTLIADFTLEDVWETLALAGQGHSAAIFAFAPDFNATRDLYRDATGECVIVAGERAAQSSACGARFGCSLCTAIQTDRSMMTMLADPRFQFMQALNDLREFLVATQNDFSRRRWVGRGFHPVTGHVKIAPDGYSSAMCEELLCLMLTIDAQEQERAMRLAGSTRAYRAGKEVNWPDLYLRQCAEAGEIDEDYLARMVKPQFRLISAEALLMIDFAWARYSVHRPFRALWCYREVYERGRRFKVPKIDPATFASEKYPEVRWAPVLRRVDRYNPLFDPLEWSLMDRPGVEMPGWTEQTVSMQVNEDDAFTVDEEGAYFILHDECDYLLKTYHNNEMAGPMNAVHYYLRIGTISVPKGRIQETGALAERNMQLKAAGLDPQFGPDRLLSMPSISDAEHKALIAGAEANATAPVPAPVETVSASATTRQGDLFSLA